MVIGAARSDVKFSHLCNNAMCVLFTFTVIFVFFSWHFHWCPKHERNVSSNPIVRIQTIFKSKLTGETLTTFRSCICLKQCFLLFMALKKQMVIPYHLSMALCERDVHLLLPHRCYVFLYQAIDMILTYGLCVLLITIVWSSFQFIHLVIQ